MTRLICFLVIVSFVGMGSCKKEKTDPDYCASTAWSTAISADLNAATNAYLAYAQAPSTATCNAAKAAYQDYIDELGKFSNCTAWAAATQTQWQAALDAAQDNLATLCDE